MPTRSRRPTPSSTTVPDRKADKELLELAEELIERKIRPFDPKKFKDPYRRRCAS